MGTSAYMYTYLGAFDKIAEWIFSGISKALTWLFQSIFGPIFTAVLEPLATEIISGVMVALSSILYDVFRGLLRLIDIIQTSFMIFAGVTPVVYHEKSYSLVELFFTDSAVGTAFRGILILSLTLCFLFSIVAVIRKMADLESEQQRSLSMILTDTIKSILGFFILPVGCLAAIYLAGAVLTSVNNATAQTSQTGSAKTIATTLFEVSVSGALTDDMKDAGSEYQKKFLSQANPWETVTSEVSENEQCYCIDHYINLWDIDYVVGYFSAIFLIWNLMAVSFAFVQRIFEIILLYLVSPFFAALLPLDGGERLKKWENMFVAKLAGGMGQIIMVNLYLMLVPIVMNGDINLTGGAVTDENTVYEALIKLIFLLGAAMAVKNGATLFTSLLDYQAGISEQETMRGGMMAISAATKKTIHKTKAQSQKFSQERAASAPEREAKKDGYRFAKAEKTYNNRMRKADELEKQGFQDQANEYRTAAAKRWNHTFNKYAKKGMVSRSENSTSGYEVKNSAFKYGIKKNQHKRGLLSLPHKTKKLGVKTIGRLKSIDTGARNIGGLFTGANTYRTNVKGYFHDHASLMKNRIKKTFTKDPTKTSTFEKGVEHSDKKYSGPMPEKREAWDYKAPEPNQFNNLSEGPRSKGLDIEMDDMSDKNESKK